jgi:diguanylate cyclase (GGDEF)-like protein
MQLLRDSIAFDELTGALKAQKLKDVAARVLTDSHRHGESSSLLSIDVDYLRRINAEYGRELGNEVLRELCKIIKEHAHRRHHRSP